MADPVVNIKQGTLRGLPTKDFDGDTYYKFLGIPYAKPPVGDLRFKAPQPPEAWTGIRDATKEGNRCYGIDTLREMKDPKSEDCLFLNVYTKQLPGPGVTPKPVMVHLHGGGFVMLSGNEEAFGNADFLMTGDIVFVNLNYRLGAFGFLSLDDPSSEVPGNAGLKDQRMALKWIQDNISNFNGDPNNVTIFGISAGGASVHYQVLSKSSHGLFHKAICQSGTAISPWAWGTKNNATALAEKLGTKPQTEKEALDFLMKVDAEKLFEAWLKTEDPFLDSRIRRPFGPVIETPNATEFITSEPLEIMKSGTYNQVPLIIGCTSNEGFFFEMCKKATDCKFYLEQLVPWYTHLKPGSVGFDELKKSHEQFYFKNGETPRAVCDFYSDVHFVSGLNACVTLLHETTKHPVYCYVYDSNTQTEKEFMKSVTGGAFSEDSMEGATHGNDYLHLFRFSLPLDDESITVMRHMIGLWTSFAKTGVPKSDVQWEPVNDPNDIKFLRIASKLSIIKNPFAQRSLLWEQSFKKYTPTFK